MIGVGTRIRDYEIIAPLTTGGMATLFVARKLGVAGFARHVAIKVVHPHLATDPHFIKMFIDEALLSARIQHPNVVHIEELGEADGTYFLAMEYVHGSSLSTFLGSLTRSQRRLAPGLAVWIAMRVAEGLHAAHELKDEQGRALEVVHRDVSPQNVLLSSGGNVKVIDFGIAKALGQSHRTETGIVKGKLRYMAPEHARGETIDRRADIYSLGIVLWEMLTMCRFFPPTANQLKLIDMVRDPKIVPPRSLQPDIPEAVEEVVLAILNKDRDARPKTALEMQRMLTAASPEARSVDAAQIADMVGLVIAPQLEERKKTLPPSMTAVLPMSAEEMQRAEGVFRALTLSAPNAALQSESSDVPPSEAPPSEAARALPVVPATAKKSSFLWVALAVLALGVAGGLAAVLYGASTQGATSIEATARPPAVAREPEPSPVAPLVAPPEPRPEPETETAPETQPVTPSETAPSQQGSAAATVTPVEAQPRSRRRPQKARPQQRIVNGVPIVGGFDD